MELLKAEIISPVRSMKVAMSFPLEEEVVLSYDNNEFLLSQYFPPVSPNNKLPIVGIYSHPSDQDKIILARLMEQGTEPISRNRIIITELDGEEKEVDIGELYFRVQFDNISADGFNIGQGLLTLRSEEDANKYTGQGLGSRVLQTAEGLFKNRYNMKLVKFENEMDTSICGKDISLLDRLGKRGNFFMKNGYRIDESIDAPTSGVLLQKIIA